MMWCVLGLILLVCRTSSAASSWLRPSSSISTGKGSTDNSPQYLSGNYIPAAMHVMFYLSDNMKYEVRPVPSPESSSPSGVPTTSTVRPTQPHKPGNYAPDKPKRPAVAASSGYGWSYGWRNVQEQQEEVTFSELRKQENIPENIDLFGAGPSDLLHQINTLEDVDTVDDDEDDRIEKFSINYEDMLNLEFLRQKRVPPTRAFVTLLSLYDLLTKEAKEQGLHKYNGYSDKMLKELSQTSQGSSSDQLKFVLTKIIRKRNIKKANLLKKIEEMLLDLEEPESYINNAIKYIPPLSFFAENCD